MDRFQRTGTGSGVGLAGIRERIKELGGDFTIFSDTTGTMLRATVPVSADMTTAATPEATVRNVPQPLAPERPRIPLITKAAGD